MNKTEKLKIFMIMPFHDELTKIYEEHIKKPLKEKGYNIDRIDDIFRSSSILDDIMHSIRTSDIIIAELTNKNPNVFYELGVAHTWKKYVIQICQEEHDIPFDLRHIRTIIYSNNKEGCKKLEDDLVKYILTYEIEKTIDAMIKLFKNSHSYYQAGSNAQMLMEYERHLTPKKIIVIAQATIDNRQIFESDKALEFLKPFFSKNQEIIPKYIIKQLEYYGYRFENSY